MEAIPLAGMLGTQIEPTHCKVHFAVYNGERYSIEVLSNDPVERQNWNSWRCTKNDFNRQFVFSLAQDRHNPTLWLFGGVWEVLARRPEPKTHFYDVALRDDLIGPYMRRLYVRSTLVGRQRRRSMEACLADMIVATILEEGFVGRPLPWARPDQPLAGRASGHRRSGPLRLAHSFGVDERRLRHPRPHHRRTLCRLGLR